MIYPVTRMLVWAAALTSSLAQSPVARKQFDVAAVKLNTSEDRHFEFHNLPGGNLTATGVTLKMLLMRAYGRAARLRNAHRQRIASLTAPTCRPPSRAESWRPFRARGR